MPKVHNQVDDAQATAGDLVFYDFTGGSADQQEFIPRLGHTYSLTVTVECTGHHQKATAKGGIRKSASLKVIDTGPVKRIVVEGADEPMFDEDGSVIDGDVADDLDGDLDEIAGTDEIEGGGFDGPQFSA